MDGMFMKQGTKRNYKRYTLSARELFNELIKVEFIRDIVFSNYQAIVFIYEFTDLNERQLSIMFGIDHSTVNYAKSSISDHCKNPAYNKKFEEMRIKVREVLNEK
jgi:hypothetical protein